jgi:hypothetical protein
MATARLWVTVEYFHPYLAYRDIDWDRALLTSLPKIRSAATTADFQAALKSMLDQLHDDATEILPQAMIPFQDPAAPTAQQLTWVHTATAGSLVVTSGKRPVEKIVLSLPGFWAVVRLSEPLSSVPTPLEAKPPTAEPYPNTETRLLAAIKTWGAIRYFFAYKDLMDEDWDDVFATYIPKVIQSKDATDYNLVLADLLTHLTDSNVTLHSKTLDTYFGEAPVGLRIRLLERYPVITDVLDPAAVAAGVHPGDIVKRIGGVSTTDIFRRFVQYVPASTPQRSGYDTIQKVTNGPAGSEVELTIENAQGEPHVVKLTRRTTKAKPLRLLMNAPSGIPNMPVCFSKPLIEQNS